MLFVSLTTVSQGIIVSDQINRGRITPAHELRIDSLNKAVYFNLDKGQHLYALVQSTGKKTDLNLHFYLGNGRSFKAMLNTGLNISYDKGKSWKSLPYIATGDDWYRITVPRLKSVLIATSIPYTQDDLDKLITLCKHRDQIRISYLGKNQRKFPVFEFGTDDGKIPVHYIIAGEDNWETPGMWTADAMIRYLAKNRVVLKTLTAHHLVRIVPCLSPYSMLVNDLNFVNNKGKVTYGASKWADQYPPEEFQDIRNDILSINKTIADSPVFMTQRLHWVLNIHSWWAERSYTQIQSVNKSHSGILLADDAQKSRAIWLDQLLKSMIVNVPNSKYEIRDAWFPGIARDYFLSKFNFITSVIEVCSYNQGKKEFTQTGEAIINNLKDKGENFNWGMLYAPQNNK